jgi:hypothetical protein
MSMGCGNLPDVVIHREGIRYYRAAAAAFAADRRGTARP